MTSNRGKSPAVTESAGAGQFGHSEGTIGEGMTSHVLLTLRLAPSSKPRHTRSHRPCTAVTSECELPQAISTRLVMRPLGSRKHPNSARHSAQRRRIDTVSCPRPRTITSRTSSQTRHGDSVIVLTCAQCPPRRPQYLHPRSRRTQHILLCAGAARCKRHGPRYAVLARRRWDRGCVAVCGFAVQDESFGRCVFWSVKEKDVDGSRAST
jgi:hypothetical protein